MGYLLRTNTGYKHLAKKSERAVLMCLGRDGSEMAVNRRRFFARYRFLASENGLYELVSTFCHVAPGLLTGQTKRSMELTRMKFWKNGVLKEKLRIEIAKFDLILSEFNLLKFNHTCYSSTYITNSTLTMTKITIALAQNCIFL